MSGVGERVAAKWIIEGGDWIRKELAALIDAEIAKEGAEVARLRAALRLRLGVLGIKRRYCASCEEEINDGERRP